MISRINLESKLDENGRSKLLDTSTNETPKGVEITWDWDTPLLLPSPSILWSKFSESLLGRSLIQEKYFSS